MELSSYLKSNGHETCLLIEKEERHFFSEIDRCNPDHFLIPSSILAHSWFMNMCTRLKERYPDKKVILAGTHPTFYPDIIHYPPVDIICLGEAEEAILELCNALEKGKTGHTIKNLWVKENGTIHKNPLRNLMQDLDSIGLPDRALYYDRYKSARMFTWKKFMSGRGCFHSCAYCYQPAFRKMYEHKGTYVRRKSPARVVEEILDVKRRYPITIAHFSDDLFITDLSWLEMFVDTYKKALALPFSCNSSVEFINEKAVTLLAQAGCRSIAIGIETGNEEQRWRILNKRISDKDILAAAHLIKEAGILLVTFNMLANPGETFEDALKTLQINIRIKADYARTSFCFPIPKTRLATYSIEKGYLPPTYGDSIYDLKDLGQEPPKPFIPTQDANRLTNLYYFFNWVVRFPFLLPLIKWLLRIPPNPVFRLANMMRLYLEKKIAGLSWITCYRYYRRVGSPDRRTTNFVPLV